ncbi:MAG: hypothetical protein IJ501_04660 [Bacilli bacterium]|nr:hypothetical protein [Bacilli bacterium]
MDKLKNIFFEEEEEEEEIQEVKPPKKEKEVIAKKVEIPKIKKENIEVEITPQQETINNVQEIQGNKEKVNDYVEPKRETPKINTNSDLIFDDDDFIIDTKKPKKEVETYKTKETYKPKETNLYKSRDTRDLYKKEEVREKKEPIKYETPLYAEQKETKPKTFTPSPIISPIYGILDKNYKKEEVKEKKEIRLSSRPIKMDLDSVRNKAFGDLEYDLFDSTPTKEELEEEEKKKKETPRRDVRKIYDMSKDEKPSIDKVTIGEADEYFNDLGLAYNTDYKDISKEISDGKILENERGTGDSLEDNLFDLIESMYDRED